MKIEIDQKKQTPRFVLEKKDVADANSIRRMMEERGWKILKKYMEAGRESLIENGKNGIKSRAKSELSKERWAILMGFDECSILAERIVKRAEEFSKEEYQNAGQGNDPDED